MIVDLHAHFPMHLDKTARNQTLNAMTGVNRPMLMDRIRARILDLANRIANYRSWDSGPGVTIPLLRAGDVRVALSVLYSPFDEMDLSQPYGARPLDAYFPRLIEQLDLVEEHVSTYFAAHAGVAHEIEAVDRLLAENKVALVHAVEGGFHLGGTPASITANVATLASRGVAYVTVAHLFWRKIATNAPALPFLDDGIYRTLFHQPNEGLTDLGTAAVRAMARHGVLIDVTHMGNRSLAETFALLDEIDRNKSIPVIATHIGCRFDDTEYNLDEATMRRIAERRGVMGVIFCEHYIGKKNKPTKNFDETFETIVRQIDTIRKVTQSDECVAIGSDLDGFAKPTLYGLDDARDMKLLEQRLIRHYGAALAGKICSENALRVLRHAWLRAHASAPAAPSTDVSAVP